jgi:bacterioferritin
MVKARNGNGQHGTATMDRPESEAQSGSIDVQTLIDDLNEDLAGELQAIIMYLNYAAMVKGPHRQTLREMFLREIGDEQGHAQFLSDKIVALGGVPTTIPRPIPEAATPHDMLLRILEAEKRAVDDYTARVKEADAFGDVGLRASLENQIIDETGHKEEVEKLLAFWHGE